MLISFTCWLDKRAFFGKQTCFSITSPAEVNSRFTAGGGNDVKVHKMNMSRGRTPQKCDFPFGFSGDQAKHTVVGHVRRKHVKTTEAM